MDDIDQRRDDCRTYNEDVLYAMFRGNEQKETVWWGLIDKMEVLIDGLMNDETEF
jgi:hypothetical protein